MSYSLLHNGILLSPNSLSPYYFSWGGGGGGGEWMWGAGGRIVCFRGVCLPEKSVVQYSTKFLTSAALQKACSL